MRHLCKKEFHICDCLLTWTSMHLPNLQTYTLGPTFGERSETPSRLLFFPSPVKCSSTNHWQYSSWWVVTTHYTQISHELCTLTRAFWLFVLSQEQKAVKTTKKEEEGGRGEKERQRERGNSRSQPPATLFSKKWPAVSPSKKQFTFNCVHSSIVSRMYECIWAKKRESVSCVYE